MKNYIIIALCSLLSLPLMAQQMSEEQAKKQISQAAAKIKTMQCDFVQTKHLKMLNDKMVSKGRMYYQQSDKLRWEYTAPYTYTFVINGTKVMMRNNRRNDVIDVNQNKVFREIARIMMSSVVGNCLNNPKDFKATISTDKDQWIATLTPQRKDLKAMFQTIRLYFDRQKQMVQKVELTEKKGDKTVIELTNAKTNTPINANTFAITR